MKDQTGQGPPIGTTNMNPAPPRPITRSFGLMGRSDGGLWGWRAMEPPRKSGVDRESLCPGTYILPSQGGLAALAENISYRVQPGKQEALFGWPTPHVDPV